MASEKPNIPQAPVDSTMVGITNRAELQYWSERFGVSAREIVQAVDEVGQSYKDVAFYLEHREGQ